MEKQLVLTLLIPTYNESDIVETALRRISEEFSPEVSKKIEVIFVDDGSDDLPEKVKKITDSLPFYNIEVIRSNPPIGKGASLAKGFASARAPLAGFLDVDLSTPPRYIKLALDALENGQCDAYIGSRRTLGAEVTRNQLVLKDILGFVLGWIARVLIWKDTRDYQDTQCGFKFFKTPVAKVLYRNLLAVDGLSDLEVLLRANLLGLKVIEKGVIWKDLRESKRTLRRILWGEVIAIVKVVFYYRVLGLYSLEKNRIENQRVIL